MPRVLHPFVLRPARLVLAAALAVALPLTPAVTTAQRAPVLPTPVRVLGVLQRIEQSVQRTSYTHSTRINERQGVYEFDCSAMAAYVLRRAAPRALATVNRGRPVAVDFYRTIVRAPANRPRGGWLRVARVADARPGDVLAWPRPRWFPSRNTGHVAFVVSTPRPFRGGYLVRIADATSIGHQDDSRRGVTGFGQGTILVATDPATGAGTGYGWVGAHTPENWVIPTPVAVGRPTQ